MAELLPTIRNSTRAVIIRDDHFLLLRKRYEDGSELYALPGGGQNTGESIEATLRRECHEEVGTDIEIHGLLHVADYFKERPTTPPSRRHSLELIFQCSVPTDYVAQNGPHPDRHQVDVVWVSQTDLACTPLKPESLVSVLRGIGSKDYPVYIGTLNRT